MLGYRRSLLILVNAAGLVLIPAFSDPNQATNQDRGLLQLRMESCCDYAMSEDQLPTLLAKLKEDAWLQEKLKGAADLDANIALAKGAEFDISKADWLKYQAKQTLELSDEDLEGVSGVGSWNCDGSAIIMGAGIFISAGTAEEIGLP